RQDALGSGLRLAPVDDGIAGQIEAAARLDYRRSYAIVGCRDGRQDNGLVYQRVIVIEQATDAQIGSDVVARLDGDAQHTARLGELKEAIGRQVEAKATGLRLVNVLGVAVVSAGLVQRSQPRRAGVELAKDIDPVAGHAAIGVNPCCPPAGGI